ncbi:hypothetical protein [Methanosarcina sp. MSH10X1]|uniref:hypothetical protein n=1 Tax=Methanosarcina sp. MSH10X1 TaxID=2507075 RepID=UPI0013E3DD4F|nr:hypothetical protein [Methanosarcina sp. MSH10X1]
MRGFGKSDSVTGPVSRRQDLYCLPQELGIGRAHVLRRSPGRKMAINFMLVCP